MRIAIEKGRSRSYLVGLLGASALVLAGCNGSEDTSAAAVEDATTTKVTLPAGNSPASLASESADNYDDNTYGLITGTTLAAWTSDWASNKPAGIDGKLVILQAGAGDYVVERPYLLPSTHIDYVKDECNYADAAGEPSDTPAYSGDTTIVSSVDNDCGDVLVSSHKFISHDDTNVFTYSVGNSEWVETRSNGVVVTKSMVPSGQVMDAFLEKYNIDPQNDMVVCAMGAGGTGQAMRAGRCWYMFRYWGMPKGRVAVLDGGNAWNETVAMTYSTVDTASTPPYTGTATVKDLPQLNFALQATLEDMVDVVPGSDTNILDDGVFIWDARSTNQYNPTGDSDFQSGPVQGHPNGALQLNFTNLLNPSADGYTYRTKTELEAFLNGEAPTVDDDSFISGDAPSGVGAGNAYQEGDVIITYCETTFRAMITGFASAAILGKPTRFYDGAMTEWHSLSAKYDSNGQLLMPTDSPWRTDIAKRSIYLEKSVAVDPPADASSSGYITDAYGNTAHQIIIEDFAYKGVLTDTGDSDSGGSTDDGGSTGGAPVPNGCG